MQQLTRVVLSDSPGTDRQSLSLSPLSETVPRSVSPQAIDPTLQSQNIETAGLRGLARVVENAIVELRTTAAAYGRHSATHAAQKARLLAQSDNNKRLSEEVDVLGNRLKATATKLAHAENLESLLTFYRPSREAAVRALFYLSECVYGALQDVEALTGTVAQTKDHWRELYDQCRMHMEPLLQKLDAAQKHLANGMEKCLSVQEKEEVAVRRQQQLQQ